MDLRSSCCFLFLNLKKKRKKRKKNYIVIASDVVPLKSGETKRLCTVLQDKNKMIMYLLSSIFNEVYPKMWKSNEDLVLRVNSLLQAGYFGFCDMVDA